MVDPWGSHFVVAAAETLGVLAGPAGLEAQEDQEVVTGAGD